MEYPTDPQYLAEFIAAIGADPEPWALTDDPRLRASEGEAFKAEWQYDWAPRPEYDTASNPALIAFRRSGLTAREFLKTPGWRTAPSEQDLHAVRVLTKLAAYESVDGDGWRSATPPPAE